MGSRVLGSLQDVQPRLDEGGGEFSLRVGGSGSPLSAELRREQAYLVGDLSFHPPVADEPGHLRPRASIRLREQGRVLTAELHASLEIAQELMRGRCIDLVLEYVGQPMSLSRFDPSALAGRQFTIRFAF